MAHFPSSVNLAVKNDLTANTNVVYKGKTFFIHQSESNYAVIAQYYNEYSALKTWKPDVRVTDLPTAIVGEEFKTSAQLQNVYFMLTQGQYIDTTKQIIRDSFSTIFTGQNSPTVTNLTNLSQRFMTNFEKLFSVANGGIFSVPNLVISGQQDFEYYNRRLTSHDIEEIMLS